MLNLGLFPRLRALVVGSGWATCCCLRVCGARGFFLHASSSRCVLSGLIPMLAPRRPLDMVWSPCSVWPCGRCFHSFWASDECRVSARVFTTTWSTTLVVFVLISRLRALVVNSVGGM